MAKVKKPVWPGVIVGGFIDLQAKCAVFFLSALKGIVAEAVFELRDAEESSIVESSTPSGRIIDRQEKRIQSYLK